MTTVITVSSQAELNAAIAEVNVAQSGSYSIEFANNIAEGTAGQPGGLYALDLDGGVTVTVDGTGFVLNGGGANGAWRCWAAR